MTLKQYLKLMRQPEYCGINARAMLKAKCANQATTVHGFDWMMKQLAVNFDTLTKHAIYGTYFTRNCRQ